MVIEVLKAKRTLEWERGLMFSYKSRAGARINGPV